MLYRCCVPSGVPSAVCLVSSAVCLVVVCCGLGDGGHVMRLVLDGDSRNVPFRPPSRPPRSPSDRTFNPPKPQTSRFSSSSCSSSSAAQTTSCDLVHVAHVVHEPALQTIRQSFHPSFALAPPPRLLRLRVKLVGQSRFRLQRIDFQFAIRFRPSSLDILDFHNSRIRHLAALSPSLPPLSESPFHQRPTRYRGRFRSPHRLGSPCHEPGATIWSPTGISDRQPWSPCQRPQRPASSLQLPHASSPHQHRRRRRRRTRVRAPTRPTNVPPTAFHPARVPPLATAAALRLRLRCPRPRRRPPVWSAHG